ncbi:MAG: hypothetical protein R3C97_08250 [Geminicoccaceae bacterium]
MAGYLGSAGRYTASALVALMPAVVMAAETAHGEAEHSGGMPQLDTSTYTSQIFWLVVFFVLLYWLVSKKALPKLTEIIRQRDERISGDLDKAAQLRADAEAAYAKYEADIADAHARAQVRIKELRERIGDEQASRLAELDASMAAKIADAEQRIGEARAKAMAEVDGVAVETAQAAIERLIGAKVGKSEVERALAAVQGEAA